MARTAGFARRARPTVNGSSGIVLQRRLASGMSACQAAGGSTGAGCMEGGSPVTISPAVVCTPDRRPSVCPSDRQPSVCPTGRLPSVCPSGRRPSVCPSGRRLSICPPSRQSSAWPSGRWSSVCPSGRWPSDRPSSVSPSGRRPSSSAASVAAAGSWSPASGCVVSVVVRAVGRAVVRPQSMDLRRRRTERRSVGPAVSGLGVISAPADRISKSNERRPRRRLASPTGRGKTGGASRSRSGKSATGDRHGGQWTTTDTAVSERPQTRQSVDDHRHGGQWTTTDTAVSRRPQTRRPVDDHRHGGQWTTTGTTVSG